MTLKIGLTLDISKDKTYSAYPWYALRENYFSALKGAAVFALPHDLSSVNEYANFLDGLVITGGDFDIPPSLYGQQISGSREIKDLRTKFELELFLKFHKLNKPILGICGGQQLMNVALGGSLIQDIATEISTQINHEQKQPKHESSHIIEILDGTETAAIFSTSKFMVNSTHHQAVKDLGQNLIISAIAPDGIIEAIEDVTRHFCIGIQWHPEYCSTAQDKELFAKFLSACQSVKDQPLLVSM